MSKITALLAAVAAAAGLEAAPAEANRPTPATACAEGPSEPSSDVRVRGIQTAICSYDAEELNRRLLELLTLRPRSLTVEALERIFGLPPLHTAFDDPRVSTYTVIAGAAPGQGEWKLMINFTEGFWPMLDSRPERFRGTMRPVRINPRERGEIRVKIDWLAPRQISPGSPPCLPVARLVEEAGRQGWREQPSPPQIGHHGQVWQQVELKRGALALSIDVTGGRDCVRQLGLGAEADPPVPPITAEEQAALRRASGEAMEKAILALPAGDQDDRKARNADAKFHRDSVAGNYYGAPDPVGDRIDGLGVEQLRDLLKRVVGGSPWGHAREDCEAAIEEDDPPVALARRAAKRGLDPVEVKALETYCQIYIHGRRFKGTARP